MASAADHRARIEWKQMIRWAHANGVHVCWEWRKSFANFRRDMGVPPADKTIVRRSSEPFLGFQPGNCKWA